MATPIVQIGFDQVNTELALTPTAQISMNDAAVRTLAGVPTPGTQISMTNLQGKSNLWTGTISAPQSNLDLLTWATTVASPAYPGSGSVQVTVAPGVYVYSTNMGATGAGMYIPSSFTSPVSVINNGYIMGRGGDANFPSGTLAGNPGGPALAISRPVTITNNSYIAGGGGAGDSAPGVPVGSPTYIISGGGGAGGGTSYATSPGVEVSSVGGAIGQAGANAAASPITAGVSVGGGGGRILPGVGGLGRYVTSPTTSVLAGGGGAGGGGAMLGLKPSPTPTIQLMHSGGGGGWGAAGGNATTSYLPGSATTTYPIANSVDGGSGSSAGKNAVPATPPRTVGGGAGTGGKAINLNANTVTWGATGTVYGSVA
jgi:hypothetical protein